MFLMAKVEIKKAAGDRFAPYYVDKV